MKTVFLKLEPAIPFTTVDYRLVKHGLNLTRQRKGVLIAGQRGQLLARVRKGEAYLESRGGEKVVDIIDAIEEEYGVEIIDDSDRRYSGKPGDVSPGMAGITCGEDNIVVVQPTWGKPNFKKFVGGWFDAAEFAESAFRNSDIRRMILDDTDQDLDLAEGVKFIACACLLLNWLTKNDGAFVMNLDKSVHREMVVIMMKAGFLRKAGNHYQMTIPHDIDILAVEDTVADFLDTQIVDREKYAIAMMTRSDARLLAGQLRKGLNNQPTGGGNVVLLSSYLKANAGA